MEGTGRLRFLPMHEWNPEYGHKQDRCRQIQEAGARKLQVSDRWLPVKVSKC